jgi:hypothetical protein
MIHITFEYTICADKHTESPYTELTSLNQQRTRNVLLDDACAATALLMTCLDDFSDTIRTSNHFFLLACVTFLTRFDDPGAWLLNIETILEIRLEFPKVWVHNRLYMVS